MFLRKISSCFAGVPVVFLFCVTGLFSNVLSAEEVALNEGDKIRLEVFGQESLTKSTSVSRSGHVTFPLIGQLKAAGMTTSQLAAKVESLLEKDYIRDADVTIVVEEYDKEKDSTVTILGEVEKPGLIEMPAGKTKIDLLSAIAKAGGFSDIANPKRVSVKRQLSGAKPEVFVLNASDMQKSSKEIFYLKSGDTVSVPKRLF